MGSTTFGYFFRTICDFCDSSVKQISKGILESWMIELLGWQLNVPAFQDSNGPSA
jgi:hypothetical protein